ncbi:hypothetical protein AB0L25_20845 [Spirillospora sp. NPDC052242]
MTATLLPPEFSDLEPFAETWCLATESERWERRMSSTMPELQAFYDAAFPRLRDALDHCDGFPLDDMPEQARRLLQLVHSTIMVAMCVEIWHQPQVVNGADAQIHRVGDPAP